MATNAVFNMASMKPFEENLASRRKAEQAASEQVLGAAKATSELKGAEQQMLQQREADLASATAAEEQKFSESFAGAPQREQMTKAREAMAQPFVPTKDNAQDLATLFSLIGVVGFAIGSGGKMNAQAALSAMNGMAEGYQKGRQDLYAKELKEFDTRMKQLKGQYDMLDRELKDAFETYKVNREAGLAKAQVAYAKAGADFYKKYEEKFGFANMLEYHKQAYAAASKMTSDAARELERAEKNMLEQRKLQMEQQKLNLQLAAKDEKAIGIDKDGNVVVMDKYGNQRTLEGVKPAKGATAGRSAINERYANTVYRAGNEVLRSLELIEQIGITRGGGMFANVVSKGTIPTALQSQLGQAFTEEQERNYNTAMSGIALELAYVLNGGYKPDVETVRKIEAQLAVSPQDTIGSAAYKFADTVAKLKAAIDVTPTYTEQQDQVRRDMLEKLDKYASPEVVYQRQYGVAPAPEALVRNPGGKQVVRQGKVTSGENAGKTVIEYSDGTREYK